MKRSDFVYATGPEPHRARTRAILKAHPEVRHLIGKNPWSIAAIIGLVSLQVVGALLLANASWWWILAAAYMVGAFADHSLFVMIHECAHRLLFKNPAANRIAGMLANLPQIFPSSVSFEKYHIKHHSFQGNHDLDADLPNHWEAKLINNNFLGKALWFLLYPMFQAFRVSRLKEIKPFDGWTAANWALQIVFTAAMWWWLGPKAVAYLTLSFFFSVGLHPLGGRWIQEHYLTHNEEQETYSYYGPLNVVAFNVGFHNEHHDFPSVPWNKLPELKQQALPFYDSLKSHRSWTKLWLQFLFSRELSLFSRVVRKNRNAVPLADVSKPDTDIIMTAATEAQAV
jgi:sphingolipid delta-4 desaturase